MESMNGRFRFLMYFVVVLCLLLSSCGKKTMPVPPQAVIPAPISDLAYELDDTGVALTWSRPEKTVTGVSLDALSGYIVERGDSGKDSYCPGCPKKYNRKFNVDSGPQRNFFDNDLQDGRWYFYRVLSKAGWYLTSDPSNVVSFFNDAPINAPRRLELESGDQRLLLKWLPPETGALSQNGIAYQLYRREDGNNFKRHGARTAKTEYLDKKVENGRSYSYMVKAVRVEGETVAAGLPSNIVTGTPKDLTPPGAPKNLRAIEVETGISLFWDQVEGPDIGGYRVYRKINGAVEIIGELLADQVSYVDTSPPQGLGSWGYQVSAVDKSKPANESKPSPEVIFNKIQ